MRKGHSGACFYSNLTVKLESDVLAVDETLAVTSNNCLRGNVLANRLTRLVLCACISYIHSHNHNKFKKTAIEYYLMTKEEGLLKTDRKMDLGSYLLLVPVRAHDL